MSHFNPNGNSKTVQQRQMGAPLAELIIEEGATSFEDWEAKRILLAANTRVALESADPNGVYWTARLDLISLTTQAHLGDSFDAWVDANIPDDATCKDAALIGEAYMQDVWGDVLPVMARAEFRQEMAAEGGAA